VSKFLTMNSKIFYNKIIIYLFFTIIAFLTRYFLFEGRESWHDEWHSLYVSEPLISNAETLDRYYGNKGDDFLTEFYPPLYLFILKYWFQIFGYIDENGRWLSLIAGTLCVPLSIYLSSFFQKNKKFYFTGFIIAFNLFLVWQSLEIRAHSLLVLLSLLNIIFFYKLLEKKNFFNISLYIFLSITLLSLWPISGAIFFGKTIYLLKKLILERHFEKLIFLLFVFILIAYVIINIDYLILNLSRDFHYTSLYSSFFYNYHFRTFFGSKILGGIFLITFSFLLIKNFRKIIFFNYKENLIIYIILSSYFLTLLYTFFKASIMSPKYVIFILPLIIIWISIELENFSKKKIAKFILVFCSVIFFILQINNSPIKRPPLNEALNIIIKDKSKFVTTKEFDVFNKYLITKKIFIEQNLILLDDKIPFKDEVVSFWFICLNNPSHKVGDEKLPDEKKCVNFRPKNNQFKIVKEVRINEFILKKFYRD